MGAAPGSTVAGGQALAVRSASPRAPAVKERPVEEDQLIIAAQGGSVESFSKLIQRYQGRLFAFLLGRCATRADAEDVLQDTLVNAFRYLGSYDARWRFSTWLYRIAIRNASRMPPAGVPFNDDLTGGGVDPLQECIDFSERQNLWLVARRLLSADAYAALWLRYAHDLPHKDIARALGRSQTWTKVTLMRARNRLGKELRDEYAQG